MKRWSSGREDLPIFHDDRPLGESILIVVMLVVIPVVCTVGLLWLTVLG